MICLPSTPDHRDLTGKLNEPEKPASASQVFRDVTAWLVPSLVAGLPGILITACLRFDYHVSLFKRPFDTHVLLKIASKSDVARVEANRKDGIGETGVFVPTLSELPSFRLVYFPAAVVLWAAAYLSVLYAGLFLAPKGTPAFVDNSKYAGWACILGWPLMYAGLSALAYYRGEWDIFWSYQESAAIQRDAVKEVGEEGDTLLESVA